VVQSELFIAEIEFGNVPTTLKLVGQNDLIINYF
jgi:hypothetical protein